MIAVKAAVLVQNVPPLCREHKSGERVGEAKWGQQWTVFGEDVARWELGAEGIIAGNRNKKNSL